jgi:hypothetical protein
MGRAVASVSAVNLCLRWNYKNILETVTMTQAKPVSPNTQPVSTLSPASEPAGALVKPTKVVMGRPVAPNQVDPPVDELMGYLD